MTTPSIPASVIVNVVPNVIGAGGTGLDLVGLILTLDDITPANAILTFSDAQSVADYYGALSAEAAMAAVYFGGFDGSNIKPASLLVMRYISNSGGAQPYLRGGSVASMTLAQLQALGTGTLSLSINGVFFTSGAIALGSATSFSDAAARIQTALAHNDAVGTGSIAGTTLTITAVASGAYRVGQYITGAGVSSVRIGALGTGTGGTGTYIIEGGAQTVASTTISAGAATCSYDTRAHAFEIWGGSAGAGTTVSFASGSLATGLKLTQAAGALQSPGINFDADPGVAMARAITLTQDFASFATTFSLTASQALATAAWVDAQGDRYLFAFWDTNTTVTTTVADPATAGYLITTAGYSGTALIYSPSVIGTDANAGQELAAFVMGSIAALDFAQLEGRTTLDFRSQAGLAPGVTDPAVRTILLANGYNFYGSFATANDQFIFFSPGTVSGPFDWIDSYVNQIWMNNGFQLALMDLLTSLRSIPYNSAGYALIEQAMLGQVNAAVNFGAIRAGVTLSALQEAQVNTAAGLRISDTLTQRGWYIQVKDASPSVRAARGSPPVTFWYTDGQSVQSINLASVEVQ